MGGEGAGGGREAARRLLGVCTEAGDAAAPPRSPWTGFIARGSSRRCRAASVSPHVGSRPSPAPCASPPRVQRPRPGAGPRGQLPSWPDVPFEKAGTSGEGFKERVRGVGSGPCWESTKQLRAGPAESSGHPGVPPHRTGLGGKGAGDPQLESGKAATETGHNRNSPALGPGLPGRQVLRAAGASGVLAREEGAGLDRPPGAEWEVPPARRPRPEFRALLGGG